MSIKGGIDGDGLVFLVDSFNIKSYDPGDYSDVSGSESYTPYYGITPSITLSLMGNSTEWHQYLSINSYIDIYLSGVLLMRHIELIVLHTIKMII